MIIRLLIKKNLLKMKKFQICNCKKQIIIKVISLNLLKKINLRKINKKHKKINKIQNKNDSRQ